MTESGLADTEFVVHSIAQTAADNEKQFGDLDAVVGDGDFGYSLSRVRDRAQGLGHLRPDNPVAYLQKVALVIAGRVGGTSGPLWGTAFLRASSLTLVRLDDEIERLLAEPAEIAARVF